MSERKPIPFNLPLLTGAEETYLREALHQGHFAGDGPHSHRCATYLEKLTGARKVLPTPSCTHALELAALLIDLKPGDEVILPSFTFVSTANAFALRGARLVFVDIDPRTMNIDPNEVEPAIGPRTRAVLAMHYAGIGCDLKALKDLADRHGLFLIEDAAHCIDAYSGDRHLGAIGHLGALSFHESKNIHCGEGGALLVNDPELVERAIVMREKGTNRAAFAAGKTPFYSWVDLGSSYSLGELPAAFLFAQTRALPGVTARRLQLWRLYQETLRELADTGELELPFAPAEARHNGHLFFLKCKDAGQRQALSRFLARRGVDAHFHYVPLHSSAAGRQFGHFSGIDRWTTRESGRLLRLPLFHALSDEQAGYIVEQVRQFFRSS